MSASNYSVHSENSKDTLWNRKSHCQSATQILKKLYRRFPHGAGRHDNYWLNRIEVVSSRPDHLLTLSVAKTSELSLLVKSPFRGRSGRCRQYCSDICFCVPSMSKLTTLTVESLWTASTETVKQLILAIDEPS